MYFMFQLQVPPRCLKFMQYLLKSSSSSLNIYVVGACDFLLTFLPIISFVLTR